MVKKTNRKSTKPIDTKKTENKFEQKINKQKHNVLGQKFVKGIKGQPTHSKSLSIKKRMETLLVEYQAHGKGNLFSDKRIGEKDKYLTMDEKNLKRFKLARKSHNLFNLGDGNENEDELTHAGQKLSQIENFEDPQISDDEEEDRKISFEMQKEHFGGGKFEGEMRTKSHADKMAELVLQSIINKNARKKEKNELLNDIDEINESMKDILPKLSSQLAINVGIEKAKPDDLDLKMKMLMFLPKGKPCDRSKSEEEKVQEEKQKLDKFANERVQRMKIPIKESSLRMQSADDLYTNYDADRKNKNKKVKFAIDKKIDEDNDVSEDNDNKSDDPDGTDEDDDESDDDNEFDDVNECDDEDDDNLSDVLSLSSCDDNSKFPDIEIQDDSIHEMSINIKELRCFNDFLSLLKHSENGELIVVDRLQKEFHKNIINAELNEFENLFDYLFKYIIDHLSGCENPNFGLSEKLLRPLFDSMQKDALHAGTCMANRLSKFQEEFVLLKNANKGMSHFPKVKVLIFCKLVSMVMPGSDFHHHVCSPTLIFMAQLLNQCMISNASDVSYGLAISSISLEMVSISKRFIPEVINFLSLVLFLANGSKYVKNFEDKLNLKQAKNLEVISINNDLKSSTITTPLRILKAFECGRRPPSDNSLVNSVADVKLGALLLCLELVTKATDLYAALPAFNEIFVDVRQLTEMLPVDFCPEKIKISAKNLTTKLLSVEKDYRYLSFSASKPKPLKLFEPRILQKVDDRKTLHGSRESKVQQRELIKLKKLKKGSEREIRKDQRFLREHILADKIQKNKDREEKTKRILSSLMVQEGEFKTHLKNKKMARKSDTLTKKSKIEK